MITFSGGTGVDQNFIENYSAYLNQMRKALKFVNIYCKLNALFLYICIKCQSGSNNK